MIRDCNCHRRTALLLAVALAYGGCNSEARQESERLTPPTRSTASGADLLLITIDTLRADALGFMGNTRVETPVLDRLANSGRVFEHAYAHNVVTLPSHANILTGRYPYEHGIRDNSGFVLPESIPTLATLLRDAGYRTAAFVAAYPLDARFGLDRGFDHYDDGYPRATVESPFVMPERSGQEVVAAALAWWQADDRQPRFAWVHLFEPHAAYDPPEPFASRYADAPYLGEVAATDAFLEPLLASHLDGTAPPAVLVMTSDHGEGLGEKGEPTHGLFCYEATLRIPLVLSGPGVAAGRDRRLAGHVDLLPTLMELLHVEAPNGLPGRSLLEPAVGAGDGRLYFEALSSFLNRGWAPLRGLLEGREKYIDLPLPEHYDLARDPREEQNLVGVRRRRAAELRREIPAQAYATVERQAASPEEIERLRSLGYLAGSAPTKERFTADDDPKSLVELDAKIYAFVDRFQGGELEPAIRLAEELVAARPTMALAHEHLALAQRANGDTGGAIRTLEQAWSRGLDHPMIARQLGLMLSETGRASEAVPILERVVGDGDLETVNALAVAYFSAGRNDEARRLLEGVLSRHPRNVKALEVLGAVALREGDPVEAQALLERALAVDEALPIVWNSLGVARFTLGDAEAAAAAWQRAVALDGTQRDALFNLGLTAASLGRLETAREALRRYLETAMPGDDDPALAHARRILTELGGS